MARGRSDLFLVIGGDVTPLRSAIKAGKSILNEFGSAAIDIRKEVDKAFAGMAANAPTEAKRIEQAFSATFAEIRRNAKAVLDAPSGKAALQIFDVAGAQDAARAAEREAAALRQAANAAIAADKAAGGTNAAVRVLAVASETAAREAAEHATALRGQAQALELVAAQSGITATKQQQLKVASGQTRLGMQQLGFQLNDIAVGFATGQKPSIIFAQQISQVTQAVQLMSGGTSKFASFLGGPWGIALTLAVTVLAPLVAKLFEGSDAASKYKDSTDLLAAALNGEKIATDAVHEALKKLNEEGLKALQIDTQRIDRLQQITQETLNNARAEKTRLEIALNAAKADLAQKQAAQGRAIGRGVEAAAGETAAAQGEVDRLQRAVDGANAVIGSATAQLSLNIVRLARGASTAVGQAQQEFDRKQAELEERFLGKQVARGGQTVLIGGLLNAPGLTEGGRKKLLEELTQAEHKLNVERQKAVDKAQKLDQAEQGRLRSGPSNAQSGRQVSFDEAAAIARAGGLQVNSAFRSNAQQAALFANPAVNRPGNPVAPPGSSAHNGAKGKWALDIQITDGVGPAKIRKIFADQGVSLTKVFKENGHFHIEGSRSEAAAADTAAQKAEDKRVAQNDNFASQMQRLDQQLIDGRGQLLGSVEAQANFAREQAKADETAYELSVQKAVDDGRLRKEQGEELIQRSKAVAAQREATIAVQEFTRKQDELQSTLDQDYDFQLQGLRWAADHARSSKERRDIELQIIDILYEQKKSDLETARNKAVEAQNWKRVAEIDRDIAHLPGLKARDEADANRQNQSPFANYIDQLPRNLDEIQDRLEEIGVTALHELEDSAVRAATKLLGLKGPLGDIAGMILRLGIEKLLSVVLKLPGRAAGGPVDEGQAYVVGENGPELFIPKNSGTIVPNHVLTAATPSAAQLRSPANDRGRPIVVNQTISPNFAGNAPTHEDLRRMAALTKASTLDAIREDRRRGRRG